MRAASLSLGVLTLFCLLIASAAGSALRHPITITRSGITASLPKGWHVLDRRLTPCIDPAERLTVVGRGALVMLQERLAGGSGFRPRPAAFALRGEPRPMECCAPRSSPGWWFNFAEGGRGFYAFVYLGAPDTQSEVLSILNSLRVRPAS